MSYVSVVDPFSDVGSLVRRMWGDFPAPWFEDRGRRAENGRAFARIPLNAYETDESLVVEAAAPGFTREEIQVTVEEGALHVRAEHETENGGAPADRRYLLRQRHQDRALASFRVGSSYDPESVDGLLKNGVLTLTIKKHAEAQPKRIEVKAA